MIFSEKSIQDILNNNKQQTRRLVKEGEASNIVDFERVIKKDNDGTCITDEGIKMLKNIVQDIPISVYTNCIRKKEFGVNVLDVTNFRVKWQVGKDYAVQNKRGGKCLWYCSKCKRLINQDEDTWEFSKKRNLYKPIKMPYTHCGGEIIHDEFLTIKKYKKCGVELKPLRVKITGIKKERLLDISEEDSFKEGYKGQIDFLEAFLRINKVIKKDEHLWEYKSKENWFVKILNDGHLTEEKVLYNPEVWVLSFSIKESDVE